MTVAIYSKTSQRYLDSKGGYFFTYVGMTDRNPETDLNLQWLIRRHQDDTYSIRNLGSGAFLDGRHNSDTSHEVTFMNIRTLDKYLLWKIHYSIKWHLLLFQIVVRPFLWEILLLLKRYREGHI